jgi:superfamily II DNA/RNA helicase
MDEADRILNMDFETEVEKEGGRERRRERITLPLSLIGR